MFKIAVSEFRGRFQAESEYDMTDGVLSFQFILENTLTVCVLAFFTGEFPDASVLERYSYDGVDDLIGLCSVCTYILNSRSTYLTWNGGKVFNAPPSLENAVCHEIVPRYARADLDSNPIYLCP